MSKKKTTYPDYLEYFDKSRLLIAEALKTSNIAGVKSITGVDSRININTYSPEDADQPSYPYALVLLGDLEDQKRTQTPVGKNFTDIGDGVIIENPVTFLATLAWRVEVHTQLHGHQVAINEALLKGLKSRTTESIMHNDVRHSFHTRLDFEGLEIIKRDNQISEYISHWNYIFEDIPSEPSETFANGRMFNIENISVQIESSMTGSENTEENSYSLE